jgi:hypothetical protein
METQTGVPIEAHQLLLGNPVERVVVGRAVMLEVALTTIQTFGLFQTLVPLQHKQGLVAVVLVGILAVMALPVAAVAVAATQGLGVGLGVLVPLAPLALLEIRVQPQPR